MLFSCIPQSSWHLLSMPDDAEKGTQTSSVCNWGVWRTDPPWDDGTCPKTTAVSHLRMQKPFCERLGSPSTVDLILYWAPTHCGVVWQYKEVSISDVSDEGLASQQNYRHFQDIDVPYLVQPRFWTEREFRQAPQPWFEVSVYISTGSFNGQKGIRTRRILSTDPHLWADNVSSESATLKNCVSVTGLYLELKLFCMGRNMVPHKGNILVGDTKWLINLCQDNAGSRDFPRNRFTNLRQSDNYQGLSLERFSLAPGSGLTS